MPKSGEKVIVEYIGTLEDGTVFDSSEKHGKPLEFTIGNKQVILGFENAIAKMKKGEEKKIKLKPEEAYGQVNPQLIKEIPRSQIPDQEKIKVGMVMILTLPNGMQIPARIVKADNDLITIDLNHPLAGKTLNFKIKLIDIVSEEKQNKKIEGKNKGKEKNQKKTGKKKDESLESQFE